MKTTKALLLLCILLVLKTLAQSQSYVDDAAGVAKIQSKFNGHLGIHFKVVSGLPQPLAVDSAAFNKLLKGILTAWLGGAAQVVTKQAVNTPSNNTGAPMPGATSQPTAGMQAVKNINPGAAAQSLDVAGVTAELKWILFLINDNTAADYRSAASNFPAKFQYLADILNLQDLASFDDGSSVATNFGFQSTLINGAVDFIVKRAKQEMVNTYLEAWYQKYAANNIVNKLAPQTLGILKAFNDDNSLNLAQYGGKWKAAFQEDLRNIPLALQDENLVDTILSHVKADNELKKQAAPAIAGGDKIIYGLYQKQHIYNILGGMSEKYIHDAAAEDADPAIFKRMVVMSNSLLQLCGTMSDNNTYLPVSVDKLGLLDQSSWQILLKLFYLRQFNGLNYCFGSAAIDSTFTKMVDVSNISKFVALYKQSLSAISSYQELISKDATTNSKELSLDDSRKLFDQAMQIIDQSYDLYTSYAGNTQSAAYATVKAYYSNLSEMGEGISTQQYGKALDGASGILTQLASQAKDANTKNTLIDEIRFLQVYGSFMVNILTAKNSDDVSAALDELVPQGQYETKNTTKFSISLSAYPGAFGGIEGVKVYPTDAQGQPQTTLPKVNKWAGSASVYLPIGIDFSLGGKARNNNPPKYNSVNLMLQAVDLGAVLNYRLSGDGAAQTDPNVSFRQVLSPGLLLMRHFNSSPLVVGIGMNYSPQLRDIDQSGNVYQAGALRFGAFIAIDVTFFNLNVSKK